MANRLFAPLFILSSAMIFSTSVIAAKVDQTRLSELIESLRITRFTIFYEMIEMNYRKHRLIIRSMDHLHLSISANFVKQFPRCYDSYLKSLIETITDFLLQKSSISCFKPMESLMISFGVLLDQTAKTLISMYRYESEYELSIKDNENESIYEHGLNELEKVKQNLFTIKNWTKILNPTTECFEDFVYLAKKKMMNFRLENISCNPKLHYEIFLKKLSLYPLKIDKLVNPEEYWYPTFKSPDKIQFVPEGPGSREVFLNDDPFQNSQQFYNLSIEDSVWLMDKLSYKSNYLNENIGKYIQNLQSKMNKISNHSISYVQRIVSKVLNKPRGSHDNRDCSARTSKINQNVRKLYSSALHVQCFSILSHVIKSFLRIQINLTNIATQFKSLTSCSPPEVCDELTAELMNIEIFFDQWERFNLVNTWRFARKCYQIANLVVFRNINKFNSETIDTCQMIPIFEGLYPQLPINDQEYPEFLL